MEEWIVTTQDLIKRADILYKFVDLFSDYENTLRDYGCGVKMNMAEVHMISAIESNPGITTTDLSELSRRTKGAVSQILSKLESKKYIIRVSDPSDAKKKLLFVTANGKKLSDAHNDFDIHALTKTFNYLLRDCTKDEIYTFYKVMNVYNNIMESGKRKQKRLQEEEKQRKNEIEVEQQQIKNEDNDID